MYPNGDTKEKQQLRNVSLSRFFTTSRETCL